MVFLHEYGHGYFGKRDNYTPAKVSSENRPDMYGVGISEFGNVGENVMRINQYRSQLNLPIRMQYEGIEGQVVFRREYSVTNNRGKTKIKYEYFLVPAFKE